MNTKELIDLNNTMLGLGAPVVIDGQGYNKVDYQRCYPLSQKDKLSKADELVILNSLHRYVNTQLKSYKQEIEAEIASSKKGAADTSDDVRLIGYSWQGVSLTWKYNKAVKSAMSSFTKEDGRWIKTDDGWKFLVNWDAIPQLEDALKAGKFDTSKLHDVYLKKDELKKKCTAPKVQVNKVGDNYLHVAAEYDKKVLPALKNAGLNWNRNTKDWYVPFSSVTCVYDAWKSAGFDVSALQPYYERFSSYTNSYELVKDVVGDLPFHPYPYQIEDAKKMLESKVCLNGNEMGLGKTLEMILVGESIPMKKLVICPPSLRLNWKREILQYNSDAKVTVLYDYKSLEFVDGWNIVGYPLVAHEEAVDAILEAGFQVVIADEAHYVKAVDSRGTAASKRAEGALKISAQAEYVYAITGTPKANRNADLYNVLKMVRHPLTVGKYSWYNYSKRYCGATSGAYGMVMTGNTNDEELSEQLSDVMVRHLRKDVLPNLKKQRIVNPVSVDLREYKQLIEEYMMERAKAGRNGAEALARLQRARRVLATQKVSETIAFTKDMVDSGEKVVIVTCFNDVVKVIRKAFEGDVLYITGGLGDNQKQAMIDSFQNGPEHVMVMNVIAGGVGVTLTASHVMVMNDFDWVPGNIVQAEDRICRSGQTELCNIYYMVADGAAMDEVMANKLTGKFKTINAVVDAGKGDEVDYISLLEDALEHRTGKKIVRHAAEVPEDKDVRPILSVANRKALVKPSKANYGSLEDVISQASSKGIDVEYFKGKYRDDRILRMRLVMALKKVDK